ncbi:acyl-CoA dehydrogenase family protein [Salinibacterium sp. NSLL150]|uniref:acyl-CoA dehydrogenase family protein n=1 Tax=unclassified Salinibacterium TaxID=2632331 RepID=UPI0018CCDCFA|nr:MULTISPECIES: acyl-CoA dehydrogenase family protein [unclassified Salinibacterium]MBH0098528.1 acyl-CoA dehydrogenase family protein [Salinibacterium sp. NSLL35]MBH0101283.1 acyl-CoA dehydrogenase family protein [Salinibacterium sp. NSLL150]MBH0104042.1 acyl-CoA dehydrogenase family protein [Salinibacterium sp. NSLL16]MBH0106803.1 acyl-CoA dehydrogenase family protein [Salinibacterium sp. NSLL17]MBH0109425.1 acyl-CoA dehydrogenase family protein [Salinibacterium sp. NG22]
MSFETLSSDFYGYENALTDQEKDTILKLRAFLDKEVRPIANDLWAKAEFFDRDVVVKGLADLGLFGLPWAETQQFPNSAVFRGWVALELARVDASAATLVGMQNGLVMGSIGVAGSQEQRDEWLPKFASGELLGAFGLTEPLSGSDTAQGLQTVAKREGDNWIINGAKRWIGNGSISDVTIIWARDEADNQVKGFIVPTSTPGYSATRIENKQALRIVQNADIVLEDVIVPESNRLQNSTSFRDTAAVLRLTRAEVAWAAVGNSIGAYEAAVKYTGERIQFGKTISSHQLVQEHLAKSLGNITASIGMVTRVSEMLDEGTQKDEHAALAKEYTASRMRETVAWCREVLGGNGIVLDYGVMRHFADAEAIYSYEGTREMNTLIVGRAITGKAAFV